MVPASGTRRALFFAYYFPPLGGAGSQRALSFARHLPEHGWEVVVVTPREGVFGRDDSLPGDGIPGVKVIRTGTLEPAVLVRRLLNREETGDSASAGDYVDEVRVGAVGGALRTWARDRLYFPDSCRGWISHAVRAAGREHRTGPFSAVLSSSPPVSAHLAAERFSTKQGLPWIADWRDPWTKYLDPTSRWFAKSSALEKKLLDRASGLLAATEGLEGLLRDGNGGREVVTVRNGFEPALFTRVEHRPPEDGMFRIVYAGTVHEPGVQSLGPLFESMGRMRGGSPRWKLRLRLLGKVHPAAVEMAREAGVLDSVDVVGFLSSARCVEEMADARLLLMVTTNRTDEVGNIEVPAKTYEYLGARRPILALTEASGESARVLKGRAYVWVCSSHDSTAIEKAIRKALEVRNPVLPPWPDIENFTRATQAAKVAEVLDQVVAARSR